MKEVLNMLHFTRGQVVHADDVEILFNETVHKGASLKILPLLL